MRPTVRLRAKRYTVEIPDLIRINGGTFYKDYPTSNHASCSSSNPPLYPDLNFKFPATAKEDIGKPLRKKDHYAVVGANPTPFLTLLQGGFICTPPGARTYPYLSSDNIPEHDSHLRVPSNAIKYVGFNNKTVNDAPGGVRGAYLSARYESRREETDWSLQQYLRGETELNPSEELKNQNIDAELFSRVVRDLRLEKLLDLPVSHLSNGQTRRSRIAKALLDRPRLLLLDEPFMGLDPPTLVSLSPILKRLSTTSSPLIVLGLRPQDPIPTWITHIVYLGENNTVVRSDRTRQVLFSLYCWMRASEGGDGTTSTDRTMASKVTAVCGPPPQALPPMLTRNGILERQGFEKAWELDRAQRHEHDRGYAVPSEMFPDAQRPVRSALTKLPGKRTIRDWLLSTTNLSTTADKAITQALQEVQPLQPSPVTKTSIDGEEDILQSTTETLETSEPLVELNAIIVKYGSQVVLGHPPPQPGFSEPGLNLTISRGTRLLLLGPNGSGKTTLLSLLTSDHPQSYSLPIKFFGRTRLPAPGKPGLSLWEIQSRIGHSSPEVHAFFPKGLSVRQALESAWAETFSSKPKLTPERRALVDHFLRVWQSELCHDPAVNKSATDLSWASDKVRHPTFGRLSFATQRLLLLLRAIIKQPDIIILDEAFSGMPTNTRIKALNWLETGDNSLQDKNLSERSVSFPGLTNQQALIVVSHVREEVPGCIDEYVRLPSEEEAAEHGKTVDIAKTKPGYMSSLKGWNQAWGL